MPHEIAVFLIKSFTNDTRYGSPTGVILDADYLTDEQMQAIAVKLNFAETAFVLSSGKADYRLRFFAPNHEVDICGHATIACFSLLVEQGNISLKDKDYIDVTQETRAGILNVRCHKDGRIVMAQNDPVFGKVETNRGLIAKLLGISTKDFLEFPIQVVSTGTPKLIIPVRSHEALCAVKPDIEGIKKYCRETPARGFYPVALESPIANTDFFARQFNPLADENEDPITGIAAGALGCYAHKYNMLAKEQMIVSQGYNLGMGGNMYVDIANGVRVGGYAVSAGRDVLNLKNLYLDCV